MHARGEGRLGCGGAGVRGRVREAVCSVGSCRGRVGVVYICHVWCIAGSFLVWQSRGTFDAHSLLAFALLLSPPPPGCHGGGTQSPGKTMCEDVCDDMCG